MLVPRGGDASTDAPKTRKPTLMNAAAAQLVAVVDGSNVAWAAIQKHKAALANSASPPPLRGLVICVNFLLEHGHKPVAICPEWWFRPTTQLAEDDAATLKALLEHEIAVSAPPDSHDDYSVLSCAIMFQSSNPVVIITNDLMRDHQNSFLQVHPQWLRERRVGFSFSGDMFIPNIGGQDPGVMQSLLRSNHFLPTPPVQFALPSLPMGKLDVHMTDMDAQAFPSSCAGQVASMGGESHAPAMSASSSTSASQSHDLLPKVKLAKPDILPSQRASLPSQLPPLSNASVRQSHPMPAVVMHVEPPAVVMHLEPPAFVMQVEPPAATLHVQPPANLAPPCHTPLTALGNPRIRAAGGSGANPQAHTSSSHPAAPAPSFALRLPQTAPPPAAIVLAKPDLLPSERR